MTLDQTIETIKFEIEKVWEDESETATKRALITAAIIASTCYFVFRR